MFHHEDASGAQHPRLEDFARNLAEAGEVVGRIGEDDVEAAAAALDIAQGVAAHQGVVVGAKLADYLGDESLLGARLLDARGRPAAAGKELVAHGAGAREEVQGVLALEVYRVLEHVENILAGEVRGRPRRDVRRHVEAPASVFASDYSHSGKITDGKGAAVASPPAR